MLPRLLWNFSAKQPQGRVNLRCDTSTGLDMKTLVWARGEAMSLDRPPALFRCPKCGSRKITVAFDVPNQPKAEAAE